MWTSVHASIAIKTAESAQLATTNAVPSRLRGLPALEAKWARAFSLHSAITCSGVMRSMMSTPMGKITIGRECRLADESPTPYIRVSAPFPIINTAFLKANLPRRRGVRASQTFASSKHCFNPCRSESRLHLIPSKWSRAPQRPKKRNFRLQKRKRLYMLLLPQGAELVRQSPASGPSRNTSRRCVPGRRDFRLPPHPHDQSRRSCPLICGR